MYKDTVTIFTQITTDSSVDLLISSIFNNTEFQKVNGVTYSSDGESRGYSADLLIKSAPSDGSTYIEPKAFSEKMKNGYVDGYYTFVAGQVVVLGDLSSESLLHDDGSLYSLDEIITKYDNAYHVLSVSTFKSGIVHTELVLG